MGANERPKSSLHNRLPGAIGPLAVATTRPDGVCADNEVGV